MSDAKAAVEMAKECRRLEESCLYSSTTFFIWLRFVRMTKIVFIVAPIVFGALASWSLLEKSGWATLIAVLALLAGLFPAIFEALRLNVHIDDVAKAAAGFKNLQDRFRQCAIVFAYKPLADFEAEFKETMMRLEEVRQVSLTAPEWCFKRARAKIQKGHYTFDVDIAAIEQAHSAGQT